MRQPGQARSRRLLLAACAMIAPRLLLAAPGESGGVLVERVVPGSAAEKAGLRGGDRLLTWAQGDRRGEFRSPLDLAMVEVEQGPRGEVLVQATRQGAAVEAALFPDDWGLVVNPPPSLDDPAPSGTESPGREAHRLRLRGRRLLESARLEEAATVLERSVARFREHEADSLSLAAALADVAAVARERGLGLEEGQRAAEEAAGLRHRIAPRSLAYASSLEQRAGYAATRPEATRLLEEALALKEALAPASLALADTLDRLASSTGDAEMGRRALALFERLDPGGAITAESLSSQSLRLADEGDWPAAEEMAHRSVALLERLRPRSPSLARSLTRVGSLLYMKGDLGGAEEAYRRALEISESLSPGSVTVAIRLNNLAAVNRHQLELPAAESHLRRAIAMLEKEQPSEKDLRARCYASLGDVARDRGDHTSALRFYRRSKALLSSFDPDDPGIAYLLEREGLVFDELGRAALAEARYRQALALAEKRYPRTESVAAKHHLLGDLARRRGRHRTAERHLRAALHLREELSPGSLGEAESSRSLGLLARRRGRHQEALALLQRAVDALEAQGRNLGGSPETRIRFRARYRDPYRDLEDLLVELGRPQDAFFVSERARARGLLALIASRRLRLDSSIPPDLERERVRVDSEYDRRLAALAASGGAAPAERDLRLRELQAARARREEVRSRIRAAVPRAAALLDPVPLDLPAVSAALDPGTVLLAYSVGRSGSRVFAVGPGPGEFAALPLGVDEASLRRDVRRYRQGVASTRGRLGRRALRVQGEALARRLLSPLGHQLDRAQRVLIVPDGPLHLLPFAALPDPRPSADGRYLVESLPLHSVSSATLLAALGSPPVEGEEGLPLVAFGDPVYPPSGAAAAPPVRARALGTGLELRPLPSTRPEVETLRELSSEDAQLWLGAAATEERAKSVPARVRVLHFACHGFVDADFPLESGLALSIPSTPPRGENGFLQAWEVLEQVRSDADLVTLSACQTGLGKDMAGEGLLGLTWAFQYAGARSVLASLWEVSDESTVVLMRGFYRALAGGATKAEALRQAQVAMLRRPELEAPFHWAAFQLIGDGR